MEVCCTLGMIEKHQAVELKKAGLTAYNHNLDTSREYYPNIITTRTYDDRLQTLQYVWDAGINVCSGNLAFNLLFLIQKMCFYINYSGKQSAAIPSFLLILDVGLLSLLIHALLYWEL